ncbi:MAG: LacI family DNA-binding transcriptional regulator, partial [Bulleidia sp.]|nr:LacI family DNA-binding transcriptional regulator [Bulleidia sp.]
MSKVTIDDIAKRVNVSKSTVSRYLNGGSVKPSTRDKIQKIVDELDYHPNAFARLNAKQSRMIGVIVPTINSKVTARVITSIDRYKLRRKTHTLACGMKAAFSMQNYISTTWHWNREIYNLCI